MSEPFLSEIRIMSFNFAPKNWAECNGQVLPINQNQALFSLFGTTYGGNGITTFALPNLKGRVPMHFGNNHNLGETAGEAVHTLIISEIPTHNHLLYASSTAGNSPVPANNNLAQTSNNIYGPLHNATNLDLTSVSTAGSSQPHSNMQPYLTLNFCIALVGIFPSRS